MYMGAGICPKSRGRDGIGRVAKPHKFFVRLKKISSIARSPESSANLTKI